MNDQSTNLVGTKLEPNPKNWRIVEENKQNGRDEIYSAKVKAGKRTYFFDVKSTRSNDYYLTITESKKRFKEDGFSYEKHKIFLYKEDFNKFLEALTNTVNHVKNELMPNVDFSQFDHMHETEEPAEASSKPSTLDTELKWDWFFYLTRPIPNWKPFMHMKGFRFLKELHSHISICV